MESSASQPDTVADSPSDITVRTQGEVNYLVDRYGISQVEAQERLALEDQAGSLMGDLEESAGFAGLWIEDDAEFGVVVQVSGTIDGLNEMIAKRGLGQFVVIHQAKYSLEELTRAHDTIRQKLDGTYDSQINEKLNKVELFVLDDTNVQASVRSLNLDLPTDDVMITVVDQLAMPTAAIYGGLHTSPCTIGFSVKKNGSSTLGVVNAAHCSEPITYAGTTLTLQNEDQNGDDDTAWYTTPGYTPDNVISIDSDTAWERQITSKVSRDSQPIGYTACKYGKTSGYDCGSVTSRTLAPGYISSVIAVFMRLDCGVNDCSDPGDSGGPVFKATGAPTSNTAAAVGIISGAIGTTGDHDVIYMAANYISGVGADVLTS